MKWKVREKNLKNAKATVGKDEVTGKIINIKVGLAKNGGQKLSNTAFENGAVVPEDWKTTALFDPLYKGKRMRTEWKNYSLLNVVGKIYMKVF